MTPEVRQGYPRITSSDRPEPIAVIGIGCRVAGDVDTPAALWAFLMEGRSRVREIPDERWAPYLHRDPRNAAVLRDTTRYGTFLDDLPGFDAEFFGVSPREAELMDPQQRMALEVSWEALEHAGIPPRSLACGDTAVLMGVNSDDYGKLVMEDLPGIEAWTGIGTSLCGIANRVSHLLDLRGPSVALDAACAASLVAVHQACQMLRAGETSLALAGGVSALIGPGLVRVLDEAGATARDGRCKTFDAAADGYGRGEGAGVVVLKRLSDARRDGDRVLAVVLGGAVAQDGRTVGIMSPNGDAQADMFRRACEVSGVAPDTVDYVEAHGTGTPTGDPVEVSALAAVYGAGRPDDARCRIGSVKPNIGHLEGGAGVLGLIKAVLALHHEAVPPTAGIGELTPAVDWSASGLRVPTEPEKWPRNDVPRRAAVCSYGYGGTIAHILVEEAPGGAAENLEPASPAQDVIVPVSAKSAKRLARQADALADRMRTAPSPLTDVATTLWTRRTHEAVRAAIVADAPHELVAGLDAVARGETLGTVVTGAIPATTGPRNPVWVFSGHGSHWVGMGQELLSTEPAFADVIDEVDHVFRAELGFSAREALSRGELGSTDRVQALTFAMQAGLAAVLRGRGVMPAAVIGHSVGEVAACVAAGVFDLCHGAAVACYRARGFRTVMGDGAMALVRLPFADAERELADRTDVVAAISASPESTVVSGRADGVDEMSRTWLARGIEVRRVNTDVAFHSPDMDGLTAELARLTGGLPPTRPAVVPLYSTALADPRSRAARDPDYWVANLRGRVRFAEAVTAAAADGHRLFLEVSAHPVVSHSIAETLLHGGIDEFGIVPALRRDRPERRSLALAVAALWCHGAEVDPGASASDPWAADLPGTQWEHRRFWRVPTPPPGGTGVHDTASHTLLGGRTVVAGAAGRYLWETRLDMDSRPYPGDHPVKGAEIVPAAVLLNTFMAASRGGVPAESTHCTGLGLADVRLRTPVPPGSARDVQVVLDDRELTLSSRSVGGDAGQDGGWLTHTSAVVATEDDIDELLDTTVDLDAARARCTEQLPPDHVVEVLAAVGVTAMGFDWRVTELRRTDDELFAVVTARADGSDPTSWAPLIDAATSAASTVFDQRLRMPARIDRLHVHGAPPAVAAVLIRRRPDTTATDVTIADRSGSVLLSIAGMAFEELENAAGGWSVDDVARMVHRVAWHPVTDIDKEMPSGVVLVGGDAEGLDSAVSHLAAADVPYVAVEDAEDIPAELGDHPVVLVLPRSDDAPETSVDLVLRTLLRLHGCTAETRLWVLTTGVADGSNIGHAPLWGLARVAAAEYPHLWGGAIDVADGELPLDVLGALHGHGVVAVRDGVPHVARLAASNPQPSAPVPMRCEPGGTYLITGGTGALGLRMAHRLADLGARRLVLVSRSGVPPRSQWDVEPRPDAVAAICALEARGVSVHVAAIDVAAPDAADALCTVLREFPLVRGVVHAAGVEAGALLANTSADDIAAAMRPKVQGTLTLHRVFPPEQLDWMVLFSSCGYLAGFPGQGAYACANSFLDAMARHRRRLGDRTTAVAWTAWRGLGMGSDSEFVAAQLDALGMGTVVADDAMSALDVAMRVDDPNVVVLPVLPAAAGVPILADVAPKEDQSAETPEAAALDVGSLADRVVAAVATQLGLAEADVNPDLPLVELGVDSIMTVRLRRQLEKQTGLSLPPTLLWEHPTAAAVTARLAEMLGLARQPAG